MTSSPKFKNVNLKPKQSPKEIKDKIRQNYKNKVHNCRGMLMDKIRGSFFKLDLHNTLNDIYQSVYSVTKEDDVDFEDLDDIKNELIQEELEWWINEYEKCQMLNVDWSVIENNSDVICPVCQKTNLKLNNSCLKCLQCKITIKTEKSLSEIKENILSLLDVHNTACSSDVQFSVVAELNGTHIYLLCDTCMEMKMVI